MPKPPCQNLVVFPADEPPSLMVVVDAEEEFDWTVYSRTQTSVRNVAVQGPAQRIFEAWGVVPTYAVTYPVASRPEGIRPLAELLQDGRCEIGAQLHSWVTPPFEEEPGERNSFACNLPPALEQAKLVRLVEAIGEGFGVRPLLYRAGRYGFGARTASFLARLGIGVDCSMVPWTDLRRGHGPDYRHVGVTPFWLDDDRRVLELPYTVGMVGVLDRLGLGAPLHPLAASRLGVRLRLPAMLARLGLLNRIPLSPEGTSLAEAKLATRWLAGLGHRVFCLSFHSSTLLPGSTHYVADARQLAAFLDWLKAFLEFFMGEMGGRPATPAQIRRRALLLDAPRPAVLGQRAPPVRLKDGDPATEAPPPRG